MESLIWFIILAVILFSRLHSTFKREDQRWPSASRSRREQPLTYGRARVERLERLSKKLKDGRLVRLTSKTSRVEGQLKGRAVRLHAAHDYSPRRPLKYGVRAHTELHFHAQRTGKGFRLAPTFAPEADERRLRELLQDARVRRHLRALFLELGCEEVWLGDGWVEAKRRDDGLQLVISKVNHVFERLAQLARACEASAIQLTATARPSASQTCPYCRDVFALTDDVVACHGCQTMHHDECFRELGRCSSMGCGSDQAAATSRGDPAAQAAPGLEVDVAPCFHCGEASRDCSEDQCNGSLRAQRRQSRRRALERRRLRSDQWRNLRRRS